MFKILLVKYGIAWIENLQHPRKQPNHTRPEQVLPMTEKTANANPEEFAAMKAQADARIVRSDSSLQSYARNSS
jgi:hypothetical protein